MYNKIAVLRANALGDFIFCLPALQALRDTFPSAEIVLLGKELHKRLLSNRKSPVNRVIVVPPCPGVSEEENVPVDHQLTDIFFEQMRSEKFDVAFQMHGGGRFSNAFVRKLGASLTVGSRTADAEPLDISIPYTTYFNETLRYIELVSCIGAVADNLAPQIEVTQSDIASAMELLENPFHKPIAVIQPGASDPRRCWPVENFARVADTLVERGYHVCFNGVEEEKSLIGEISDKLSHKREVQDLSGYISLPALIGLLAKSALMISNDTGPLHLAYALRTPAIGLYWAPNMITAMPVRCGNARPLIAWSTVCPLCNTGLRDLKNSSCNHNTSFISEITVDEVLESIKELQQEIILMQPQFA
jgi:ADP-heptose:LPS heptosyltransferase